MKKFYATLTAVVLFGLQLSFAQSFTPNGLPVSGSGKVNAVNTTNFTPASDKCGFAAMMNEAKAHGFDDARYEQEMARLITERRQLAGRGAPTTIYTVPVIFHVSYDGTTEGTIGTGANISAALINAQIDQLNKDYANLSGSAYGVSEDMGIRFVAAKVDPSGNLLCEAGIDRINWRTRAGWLNPATLASTGAVQNHYSNTVKPQSIWDPYRYVNIWLGNFSASGLLGYATFPGQSTLTGLDNAETNLTAGVVILSGSVGSFSNPGAAAPYQYGRTATHELGHFFGMRHITGDSNCGDDFCGDTPPQSALTSGCPATGTLNGCTPSVAKMFENYMDYSNDACLNTFTLNQSERCQAVMLNSPRRKELITSTVGNSPLPNRISFKPGVSAVSETGNVGTCPRYKDYSLVLGVDAAATGNATVSLTKAGTATDGADYTILQPSVAYTNGDASDKTFTVRVYDDAAVEGMETINLTLNITGTGVQTSALCGSSNQFTITITDDDFDQAINNTLSTVTLVSENFGTVTGSNQVPAGWAVTNTGAATNKWVGNSAGAATYGFAGNTMHISNGVAAVVNDGTAPINYVLSTTTDARLTTPTLAAAGLKNISVNFDLVCDGEIAGGTVYDAGIVYYTLDGTNFNAATDINGNYILQGISTLSNITLYVPPTTYGTNTMKFMFRWVSDNSGGTQPPFTIDNVVITGQAAGVESQLNNTTTENIAAGSATSSFYSTADGQIIAKISNASANIGCVTANIKTAGTGLQPLNTTGGAFFRSDKVIILTPAVANSTATYTATFYFTTAELALWGGNVPNLKILKVTDAANLATTLTPANSTVFTPVAVDDQRAAKGYVAYTVNVTGGFSQFLLVSPATALPVLELNFTARAAKTNIILDWSTTSELNNKGFAIERSTDGVNYDKIAWIDGAGSSSNLKRYTYADNFVQPDVLYYYRLRQTDFDGRAFLSDVRQVKIKSSGISITLSPNPARDKVKIFVAGGAGTSDIKLYNAEGQLVRSWKKMNLSSPAMLDISGLAKGMYIFNIITGAETAVEKLIIN